MWGAPGRESDPFLRVPGLKAGDEVLEINQRAAEELDSALLKDALLQPSLSLTVRTHPEAEEGQRLSQPPPRRPENPPEPGDSALALPGGSQGTGGRGRDHCCTHSVVGGTGIMTA